MPLPKDSPEMLAWEEFKRSNLFANLKSHLAPTKGGTVTGLLWSAFYQGYIAGRR